VKNDERALAEDYTERGLCCHHHDEQHICYDVQKATMKRNNPCFNLYKLSKCNQ
jgi:hypothetical protein